MSLWIAQVFSQFADRAVFVLFVAILTLQQSHNAVLAESGAAQMTSWLYVAFTIPAVLLSPIAGVYVIVGPIDRFLYCRTCSEHVVLPWSYCHKCRSLW